MTELVLESALCFIHSYERKASFTKKGHGRIFKLPVPQNMTLFGNWEITSVILLDWIILDCKLWSYWTRVPPTQYNRCPQKKGKFGHRDRHTHRDADREGSVEPQEGYH